MPGLRLQWKAEVQLRLPTWLRLGVKRRETALWGFSDSIKKEPSEALFAYLSAYSSTGV